MSVPNKIMLVRHGESTGNVDWREYYKIEDRLIPLTDKGRAQAHELAGKIDALITDKVVVGKCALYSSHYVRAIQTADIIANTVRPYIKFRKVDVDLRELKWCDHTSELPSYERQLVRAKHMGPFRNYNEGGESPYQVWQRQTDAVGRMEEEFKTNNFPENLIIVSHGIAIATLLMRFLDIPEVDYPHIRRPSNCELIILQNVYGKWIHTEPEKLYHNAATAQTHF